MSHHHKKPPKKFQTYISIFDRLHHCFVLGSVLMGKGPKIGKKNDNIKKWAYNPFESGKRLKSKPIPSVLGDAGLIKVVLYFLFGHPKCHFSMGTFGKSAHLYVPGRRNPGDGGVVVGGVNFHRHQNCDCKHFDI